MESKNTNPSEDKNTNIATIIHNIKNIKIFAMEDIVNINNLSYDDRMSVLIEYNNMAIFIVSYFDS